MCDKNELRMLYFIYYIMFFKLRDWVPEDIHEQLWCKKLCSNPNAIQIIEQHPEIIDWVELSTNPNAIHILGQNLDKVDWGICLEIPMLYIIHI